MTTVNYLAEIVTTFIEIYILLCGFHFFFEKRCGKYLHALLCVTLGALSTGVTLWLNSIQLFSVPTAYVWIVMASLLGWLIYRGHISRILTVAIIYITIVGSFDFFCFSVMEFIFGFEGVTFTLTSEIGWFRTIYILSVKLILIVIYLFAKFKIKDKRYDFTIQSSIFLAIYGLFCLSCVQGLFEAVTTDNVVQMRKAVLLAWLFIILGAVSIIVVLRNRSRLDIEKQENGIISKQIEVLENDNRLGNRAYKEIAKMSHEFNNQIRTISSLASSADNKALNDYLGDLIEDIEDIKVNIYTGIESIDAVINRKEKQASELDIVTKVSAMYNVNLKIRNIDVCMILANLFDNAIEACEKIGNSNQRFINFSISKIGAMTVIKMENSYNSERSVKNKGGELATTKEISERHGYGVKIIKSIVEKYDGTFETTYKDGKFSVYLLLNDQ